MIYEFKSRATGSVIMTQEVGDRVLDLIGKRASQGIITVLEMPMILQRLRQAMDQDGQAQPSPEEPHESTDSSESHSNPGVSLRNRLVPLVEMIEQSHAKERDVTWGV